MPPLQVGGVASIRVLNCLGKYGSLGTECHILNITYIDTWTKFHSLTFNPGVQRGSCTLQPGRLEAPQVR